MLSAFRTCSRTFMFSAALLALIVFAAPASRAAGPNTVVGPGKCAECHEPETMVWRETAHHTSFLSLTRRQESRRIAQAMGVRRVKTDARCASCHFTMTQDETTIKPKAIAGVSCESCHGPASNWIDLHADYGAFTKENEPDEHRQRRLAQAASQGLWRPSSIYDLASNCFACHTVLDEKLVNVGGHPAGDAIELVAWSQGAIRHNFLRSGDGRNVESSPERRRVLYIAGRLLDLEYSLRGVAVATKKGAYTRSVVRRYKQSLAHLREAQQASPIEQVQASIDIATTAPIKLNHADELRAAADAIAAQTKQFIASRDGSKLEAIDPLLPDADAYKGDAQSPATGG